MRALVRGSFVAPCNPGDGIERRQPADLPVQAFAFVGALFIFSQNMLRCDKEIPGFKLQDTAACTVSFSEREGQFDVCDSTHGGGDGRIH